jgi:nitroimidazol reductase NimA-like FMN-containing flavoprotein (pyridoxamine 5'-phosphate oxidase superfamily)
MASLAMSREEREAFLAEPHVGVVSVAAGSGQAPLAVPIWYRYRPGGEVSFMTGRDSLKTRLIEQEQRFSLCAQTEEPPYKYVTVEGPVVAIEQEVGEEERRAIARHYLDAKRTDRYLAATADEVSQMVVVRMRPERWLTADFGKQFG